jgi:hypothetical protein
MVHARQAVRAEAAAAKKRESVFRPPLWKKKINEPPTPVCFLSGRTVFALKSTLSLIPFRNRDYNSGEGELQCSVAFFACSSNISQNC